MHKKAKYRQRQSTGQVIAESSAMMIVMTMIFVALFFLSIATAQTVVFRCKAVFITGLAARYAGKFPAGALDWQIKPALKTWLATLCQGVDMPVPGDNDIVIVPDPTNQQVVVSLTFPAPTIWTSGVPLLPKALEKFTDSEAAATPSYSVMCFNLCATIGSGNDIQDFYNPRNGAHYETYFSVPSLEPGCPIGDTVQYKGYGNSANGPSGSTLVIQTGQNSIPSSLF
jgi:hypothetical protein